MNLDRVLAAVRFKWHRNAAMRFFNIRNHQQGFTRAESA